MFDYSCIKLICFFINNILPNIINSHAHYWLFVINVFFIFHQQRKLKVIRFLLNHKTLQIKYHSNRDPVSLDGVSFCVIHCTPFLSVDYSLKITLSHKNSPIVLHTRQFPWLRDIDNRCLAAEHSSSLYQCVPSQHHSWGRHQHCLHHPKV